MPFHGPCPLACGKYNYRINVISLGHLIQHNVSEYNGDALISVLHNIINETFQDPRMCNTTNQKLHINKLSNYFDNSIQPIQRIKEVHGPF